MEVSQFSSTISKIKQAEPDLLITLLAGIEQSAFYGQWAKAVEEAGTTDTDAVIEVLESGISIDAPSGKLIMEPKTHHAIKDIQIFSADENHDIIFHDRYESVEAHWLEDEIGVNLIENPEFNQYTPLEK